MLVPFLPVMFFPKRCHQNVKPPENSFNSTLWRCMVLSSKSGYKIVTCHIYYMCHHVMVQALYCQRSKNFYVAFQKPRNHLRAKDHQPTTKNTSLKRGVIGLPHGDSPYWLIVEINILMLTANKTQN